MGVVSPGRQTPQAALMDDFNCWGDRQGTCLKDRPVPELDCRGRRWVLLRREIRREASGHTKLRSRLLAEKARGTPPNRTDLRNWRRVDLRVGELGLLLIGGAIHDSLVAGKPCHSSNNGSNSQLGRQLPSPKPNLA